MQECVARWRASGLSQRSILLEHRLPPETDQLVAAAFDRLAASPGFVQIGEEVSEQLDVKPARFLVTAISPRNAPAVHAKRSLQRRFRQR